MSQVGFQPAVPDSGLSQIHALDRAATAIGHLPFYVMGSWRYVTTCYCQSVLCHTVRVHISTPATVYLVCSGLLGAEGERTTTLMTSLREQHAVTLWRTALCVSE